MTDLRDRVMVFVNSHFTELCALFITLLAVYVILLAWVDATQTYALSRHDCYVMASKDCKQLAARVTFMEQRGYCSWHCKLTEEQGKQIRFMYQLLAAMKKHEVI